jgi:peptide/nickel transport system permease protein
VGIAVISFLLIRLVPGDFVSVMMGQDFGDAQLEAEMRRLFGLDRPLAIHFFDWFTARRRD